MPFDLVKTGDRQITYMLSHSLKAKVEQDTRGMTYEEVNLWIYCYLFMAIALVMWLWFEITIPRRWILNRLWYDHLPLLPFLK